MTPREIELVKTSFAKIAPFKDQASELFYCRLFELDPSLRLMFRSDMTEQKQKLMSSVAMVVAALDKLETVLPSVQDLGRRHRDYGVQKRHYDVIGAALLWTLEIGLGDGWNRELANAWRTAYMTLAGVMIEAADAPRLARKPMSPAAA